MILLDMLARACRHTRGSTSMAPAVHTERAVSVTSRAERVFKQTNERADECGLDAEKNRRRSEIKHLR